jgi:fused signal recognition particle receptor
VEIPPIAGRTGSFDIMAADQSAQRLYLADHTDLGVDVFDLSVAPGRYLATVPLGVEPQGIAVAEDLQQVFTGNKDSSMSIIDANPRSARANTVVGRVSTGGAAADELTYDPREKRVFLANAAEGFVSVIDPVNKTVVKKLTNLGKLEALTYSPTDGMVYVAGAGNNVIYRIDPASNQVVASSVIGVPCAPKGIAINPSTGEGILNCGTTKTQPLAIAWDFKAGKALRSFSEAGAGDMVVYDPRADLFFLAADGFTTPEIAIFTGSPVSFQTAVPTAAGSKSVTYDMAHGLVYTVDPRAQEAGLWSFPIPTRVTAPGQQVLPSTPHQVLSAPPSRVFPIAFLLGCAMAVVITIGLALIAGRGGASEQPESCAAVTVGLAESLARSRGVLGERLTAIASRSRLTEEAWEEMEDMFVRADLGVRATGAILERLRHDKVVPASLQDALRRELVAILGRNDRSFKFASHPPSVWLVVGMQAMGKTSHLAALARLVADQGHAAVVVTGEPSPAPPVDELGTSTESLGIHPIRHASGAGFSAAVVDAIADARDDSFDVVIVAPTNLDGATPLLAKLREIRQIAHGHATVTETLLMFDAGLGLSGIARARSLGRVVEMTGVVLMGLEGTTKGGIAVAVHQELGVPLKAVGVGEPTSDLDLFDATTFVAALMGDREAAPA